MSKVFGGSSQPSGQVVTTQTQQNTIPPQLESSISGPAGYLTAARQMFTGGPQIDFQRFFADNPDIALKAATDPNFDPMAAFKQRTAVSGAEPEFINQRVQTGTRQVQRGLNPTLVDEPIFENQRVRNPNFDPGATSVNAQDYLRPFADPDVTPGFDRVARFDPVQEQVQQATLDRFGAPDATTEAARAYSNQVLGGDFLRPNPHTDAVRQAVADQVEPAVTSRFALANRGGSVAEAGERDRLVANAMAPLMFQDYQRERGLQDAMAMRAPGQFQGLDASALAAQAGVGGERQGLQQSIIDRELLPDFDTARNVDLARMGRLQSLASGVPFQTSSSTQNQPFFSNSGAQTMGGLMGLASLGIKAAPLFMGSDIRLKENIEKVGTTVHGLSLYEFNYKGGPTRFRGVMAHEVEEVMPEAVHMDGDYMTVDYGLLGIEMEAV